MFIVQLNIIRPMVNEYLARPNFTSRAETKTDELSAFMLSRFKMKTTYLIGLKDSCIYAGFSVILFFGMGAAKVSVCKYD